MSSPAVAVLVDAFFEHLRPPPRLRLSQWADRYAYLSAESSAESGKWRNIPYQIGMMDAMTDPRIWKIVVKKSARVGYTKIIGHLCGYHIHYDPCPIGIVQPTEGDAEGYSKEEIAPMIRDTPVIEKLVSDAKAKDGSNTMTQKMFPGGSLSLIGANTATGFRRVSRRIMIFDEVDGYPLSAGTEGDPVKLGTKRTEYYWNRKIVMGSTPTTNLLSRITPEFDASDKRFYNVPCPHCQAAQVLKFANLKWIEGQPETAHFVCEKNGCVIEHKWKRWMVEQAHLRQEADQKSGYGWVATRPTKGVAGFHIWAAYSYSPNASWESIARESEEAKAGGIELLKTFINTLLGEEWQEKGDAPEWRRLYDRREAYPVGIIPEGGLFITAGVDVQGNRLEMGIWAWGVGRDRWAVDYQIIHGDTSDLGPEGPWAELSKRISKYYKTSAGVSLPIQMTAIDSGYNTQVVYQFVRRYPSNRVIATKGVDTQLPIVSTPTAVDVAIQGRRLKRGLLMWPVGVGTGKTEIYGFLRMENPTDEEKLARGYPPGFVHFPEFNEDWFKQLTAEVLVKKRTKGRSGIRMHWEKQYERNEVLDCAVLARAAAAVFGIDRFGEEDWAQLTGYIGEAVTTKPGMVPAAEVLPIDEKAPQSSMEPTLVRKPSRSYR